MNRYALAEGRGWIGVEPGSDEAAPTLWMGRGDDEMAWALTDVGSADLTAPCLSHAAVKVEWPLHYDQWGPSTSVEVEMESPVDAFALLGEIKREVEWLHRPGPR